MSSAAIFGGGVAGLSAAQELAERGFGVTVYEAEEHLGGKAASHFLPGTGTAGRRDLPGEHGFRFYPSFYQHVIDTMRRIPFDGTSSVADQLVASTEGGIAAVDGKDLVRWPRRAPTRPFDILGFLEAVEGFPPVDEGDFPRFAWFLLKFLTSCHERRIGQWEQQSWWDFVHGADYSEGFQRLLGAVPRTMVAMDAERGNARTIGSISAQFVLEYFRPPTDTQDRTMNGPTTERWLEPWERHLRSLGVALHRESPLEGFDLDGGRISGARVRGHGTVLADHYVLAVPIERARGLVSPEMGALDPMLERLRTCDLDWLTAWMVGAQFFLDRDVPICDGHTFYPDAPWALTSISQAQFWARAGRRLEDRYGDGSVKGVLSVDVSDWRRVSPWLGKAARDCSSEDEVLDEIWRQLKDGLNDGPTREIEDAWVLRRFIDLEVEDGHLEIDEPLLVHPPGSWAWRPEARTRLPNLVLCGDYVRNTTDLASMEGANEAARHAVNAVLDATASAAPRCEIWPLHERESPALEPVKRLDRWRWERGLPHLMDVVERGRIDRGLVRAVEGLLGLLSYVA